MPFETSIVAVSVVDKALRNPRPASPIGGPAINAARTWDVVAGLAI